MDVENIWGIQNDVETVLTKLKLPKNKEFDSLSGGVKRRVLLAKALVSNPDVLLLDEPTNHLDIESIIWLEDYLKNNIKTLLFITHDREFLKSLANRIIELDRGTLHSWNCNYMQYLERKEVLLKAEEAQFEKFDKKLSEEEKWLRKGIRARRTRNEGRVKALQKMREERKNRRNLTGNAILEVNNGNLSGKMVLEADNISFSYNSKKIVENFSIRIMRKDRIGIVGGNGCGKTTLINLLLGNIKPDKGTVKQGTNLQIIYFDQLRTQLSKEKSVADNIVNGGSVVEINDKKYHIISYLKNFLFLPEQSNTPVKALSGGEKNRLLLAKLFAQPSNLLVLDEPTNDLDIETLELLEELVADYQGTVLIVSHDRKFLDNVVTSTIFMDGQGNAKHFAGFPHNLQLTKNKKQSGKKAQKDKKKKPKNKEKTLTYKETKELEELPALIEQLEEKQKETLTLLSDPQLFVKNHKKGMELQNKLNETEKQLEQLYLKWENLLEKQNMSQ
jgi:ATP-binding cassette subfamily F protein uup